jgi:DNA mismatch endonuclease (patch repair protein)
LPKIRRNKRRDQKHLRDLRATGWKVIAIWECEISDLRKLKKLRKTVLSR